MLLFMLLRRFSERCHESAPEDPVPDPAESAHQSPRPARPVAWLLRLAFDLWSRLRR